MEVLNSLSPAEILGLTIFGEARGEPIEGQVGVGSVIRNRIHSGKYKSYLECCLAPNQFSCWNTEDPNYPILMEMAQKMIMGQQFTDIFIRQCLWVAAGISDWILRDNTKSSENYLTTKLYRDNPPKWAVHLHFACELGHHTFLYE